jgi:hypothetical protein
VRVTAPSSWPWIDHLVSGLHPATQTPCSDSVSLRLPYSVKLATECKSLTHYTKGTQSPCGSYFLYACGFRIYFTPLPGFFSPFPHGTCSLSVDYEYLALEDGPPIFRQDYTCPALLVVHLVPQPIFPVRGYHPLWPDFPFRSSKSIANEHRLFRFRSPLLSESRLMSVPRATEMFQFTRFATQAYVFSQRYPSRGGFPHSEISGSKLICQLPEAYRRLSRPSSPVIAKASTTCT